MVASQRPKGVTLLAWMAIIGGFFNLFAIFNNIWFGLVGLLQLNFGRGALKLKPWAWKHGIFIQIIGILFNGYEIINPQLSQDIYDDPDIVPILIFAIFVAMLFNFLVLFYLFRTSVKRAFGKA